MNMAVIDMSRDIPCGCLGCENVRKIGNDHLFRLFRCEKLGKTFCPYKDDYRLPNCPLKSVIGLAEEIVAKSNISIDDISTVLGIIDKYCGGKTDEEDNE